MGKRKPKEAVDNSLLIPEVARIRELEIKEREDDEFKDYAELDELRQKRRRDQYDMIPKLQCCEAIKKHPVVTFVAACDSGDPEYFGWYAHHPEPPPGVSAIALGWYSEDTPNAKFCPFCGTAVPTMRKKANIPKTVMVVTDGGYYCDNCNERLQNCLCDPPESMWEPDE